MASKAQEESLEEGMQKPPRLPPIAAAADDPAKPPGSSTTESKNRRAFLWILLGVGAILTLAVGLNVGLDTDEEKTSYPAFSVDLPLVSSETIQRHYANCQELSDDLVQATHHLANQAIARNARWYYDQDYSSFRTTNRGRGGDDVPVMAEADRSADGGTAKGIPVPSAPAITEDSYGTNNQVAGVDEADIVKSNGEQVYAAYGSEIVVLDAQNVTVLSRTKVQPTIQNDENESSCAHDRIASMLLIDERLVVVSTTGYCYYAYRSSDQADQDEQPILQGYGKTRVLVYATDTMTLLSSESLQGNYVSARSIGNNVHIVTSSWVDHYQSFTKHLDPYKSETYGSSPSQSYFRSVAMAEADSHTESFVSQLTRDLGDCRRVQQLSLMQNTNESLTFSDILNSVATVYSFDVTNVADENDLSSAMSHTRMILPTSGWEVYASETQLVLATQGWWADPDDDESDARQQTYVVTYRLEGASATAMRLGTVPGYVLNQFSMDHAEQNGTDYLRVATTTSARWAVDSRAQQWTVTDDSTSQVSILQIDENATEIMPIAGQITGLGAGERIYSVRFLGDRAFVVTFRQTDPFYTLDISDPTNPQAVGELKIPGFSNYLHPINDNLILGVGQDADPNTGRTLGLQVSLFDVSDLSSPSRIHNFVEDEQGYSTSDAQFDHRALRYLEESKLLILPVSIYGWSGDGFDGFRLYRIDENSGIEHYFSIEHGSKNFNDGCWSSDGYLESRSLVFEGDILTLKGHSVLSHDLTTGQQDAAPINLDENLDNCSPYYFH